MRSKCRSTVHQGKDNSIADAFSRVDSLRADRCNSAVHQITNAIPAATDNLLDRTRL